MKPVRPLRGLLAMVVGATFAGFMLTILIAVAIWPGEAKLVAPLLCADDQPDAFVVADTYSPQPGETTTNFTLYCVGPRGDATDQGYAIPMLILTVAHTAIVLALFLVFGLRSARRLARQNPGLSLEDAVAADLARQELADRLAQQVQDRGDDGDADEGGGDGTGSSSPIDPDGMIPPGPIIS